MQSNKIYSAWTTVTQEQHWRCQKRLDLAWGQLRILFFCFCEHVKKSVSNEIHEGKKIHSGNPRAEMTKAKNSQPQQQQTQPNNLRAATKKSLNKTYHFFNTE